MDQLFVPPNYSLDTVSMSSIILYGSHDLKLWNNEVIQHFVHFNLRKISQKYQTNKKIESTTRKQTEQTQKNIKH